MQGQVDTTNETVRVRIAPSPTGDPHVGTAYIALFNYVFAKKHGGSFILRIEDTDRNRYRESSQSAIMDALRWVGLDWDEGPDKGGDYGPYLQSERNDLYKKEVNTLIEAKEAYRCFCSAERLQKVREEQRKNKQNPKYDGHCRGMDPAESLKRAEAGEAFTVRLAVPKEGTIVFQDKLRGDVEIAYSQLDDQVLLKSDGFPTYHLANVVDDHHMKISHVIRAEEWISSTPKHVLLYKAFGWKEPEWIHMPLLRNKDKSKISKRKNPVSVMYYKDIGILPEALVNFLGNLGWSFGDDKELFSVDEMIQNFDWSKVSLGGPVFDQDKLRWFNEQYIHGLSLDEFQSALSDWRMSSDKWKKILPLMQKRVKTLNDFVAGSLWFFTGDIPIEPIQDKIKLGELSKKDTRKKLEEYVEKCDALDEWSSEGIEKTTKGFCEGQEFKAKHLFMCLRWVVTGTKASPPLFDTLEAIGKELTRKRIRNACEHLKRG